MRAGDIEPLAYDIVAGQLTKPDAVDFSRSHSAMRPKPRGSTPRRTRCGTAERDCRRTRRQMLTGAQAKRADGPR